MPDIDPFYDREYDTTLSVPDEDHYLSQWDARSREAQATLAGQLDVPYGPGEKERLDLFPALNSRLLHVFIHGGFWRVSDKAYYTWIAPPFVKAGISVALLNYDLCPAVTLATIVEQCRRGIAWLYHHARDFGIGGDRIVVTGHSAGGHLAAMALTTLTTDWLAYGMPPETLAGGIALSGLFDLEPLLHTHINDDLRLDTSSAQQLSPVHHNPQTQARLTVAAGALESSEFRRQSQLICERWQAGCVGPLYLSDLHHFSVLDQLADLNSVLWRTDPTLLAETG